MDYFHIVAVWNKLVNVRQSIPCSELYKEGSLLGPTIIFIPDLASVPVENVAGSGLIWMISTESTALEFIIRRQLITKSPVRCYDSSTFSLYASNLFFGLVDLHIPGRTQKLHVLSYISQMPFTPKSNPTLRLNTCSALDLSYVHIPRSGYLAGYILNHLSLLDITLLSAFFHSPSALGHKINE